MSSLLAQIKEKYKEYEFPDVPKDDPKSTPQLPKVHLHIDLESVREADGVTNKQAPKVSSSASQSMFDAVHLFRVLKLSSSSLGRKHLGSLSMTDYNPIIEDQRTGRMMAEMFYNICIGLCQHEQQKLTPKVN